MSNDEVMALLKQAEQCGALADPGIQSLVTAVAMNPSERGLAMMLRERMAPYLMRSQLNPDPFRPSPGPASGLSGGELSVGVIHETNLPYRLPLAELVHTLIVGPTNAGKTNLLYWLLQGLYQKVPVVVVTAKQEARMLAAPRIADGVLAVEELRIALFEPPPGMAPKPWAYRVVDLFCREYGLQFSRVVFSEVVDTLVDAFSALSRQQGEPLYPTLANVLDLLGRSRSKYAESVRTAIDGFIRTTGPIFHTARGMSMARLLTQGTTTINIEGIPDDNAARFIVSSLLSFLHVYWRHNGPCDGSVQGVLVLDDAHRFLSRQAENNAITNISHMLQLAREAGLRLIMVSQSPSELAANVLSQSACIYQVGSFGFEPDKRAMAAVFGLPPSAHDRLLNNPRGEFIAIEHLNRYQGAFGGCVERFPDPAQPVTEADRRQAMQHLLAQLTFEAAVPTGAALNSGNRGVAGAMPAKTPQLSDDARKLALTVITNPFVCFAEHKARINLSGGGSTRAKKELLDATWVHEHTVPQRRGTAVLLEPLPALASAFQLQLPSWGKGSFLHRFMQENVARRLKSLGYTRVTLEETYGSKSVDVVGTSPNQELEGFEIAVSLANVVDNVEKDLICQPRFFQITTIVRSAAEERQVQRALAQAPALKPHQFRIAVDRICNWF
jgi:hypothetical protein